MNKNKEDVSPVFETLAISEQDRKYRRSKASIPSERNVKEAKDWVDSNEK